jgi:hypothetical protein
LRRAGNRPKTGGQLAAGILIVLALLILFYGTIAWVAWQHGQRDRVRLAQEALVAEIDRNIDLARTNIAEGQLALAERRIEWLRSQRPQDPAIADLQVLLEGARFTGTSPTVPTPLPTVAIALPVVATPTLEAVVATETPPPSGADAPAERLAALRRLIENGRYEEAIAGITAFQLDYPSRERLQSDRLLFDARVKAGFFHTNGSQVARGIAYFDQAALMGELPEDARSQHYYARLYLTAITWRGINWNVTMPALEELCSYVPLYQQSCNLLYETRLEYATALLNDGDACAAAAQLALAQTYEGADAVTEQRLQSATAACAALDWQPAPTPVPTP